MTQNRRPGQIGRPEHVSLAMRRMVAEARALKLFVRDLTEVHHRILGLSPTAAPPEPDPLAEFGMTPDELAAALGLDEPAGRQPPSKRRAARKAAIRPVRKRQPVSA